MKLKVIHLFGTLCLFASISITPSFAQTQPVEKSPGRTLQSLVDEAARATRTQVHVSGVAVPADNHIPCLDVAMHQ